MATIHRNAVAGQQPSSPTLCDKDDLRASFALAMSVMYKQEVPLYGTLVDITTRVNLQVAQNEDFVMSERLHLERHGAIRLGTPYELRTVRRIFTLIGLYPVDYYDLSGAGLPMHGTAFRPIDPLALSKHPFRVFTTLLRPELLNVEARELAQSLLGRRKIFSCELLRLLDVGEGQGGFTEAQAEGFIIEALKTFRWQEVAAATLEEYVNLRNEHPILADIACFNSAHINHLTPRVLDIGVAEMEMKAAGLQVKAKIEGPPIRKYPILLRQTSFLALQEHVRFPTSSGVIEGSHKARFGEIEQRGAAVTPKGRILYDAVLRKALDASQRTTGTGATFEEIFKEYPDDFESLLRCGLIFCTFHCTGENASDLPESDTTTRALSSLLASGTLTAEAIVYEDFLPFSAAGIFRSNLGGSVSGDQRGPIEPFEDRASFEDALGCPLHNSDLLYAAEQSRSLKNCAQRLGLEEIVVDAIA